jgi:hypothetical protein
MNITVTDFVIISTDYKAVFEYIANLENDKFWRNEINSTKMTSRPKLNALAIESSYLSKRVPNHILQLVCTDFQENSRIIYQTVPESAFYLKSIREVEAISSTQTKVTYTIAFDKSVVKYGLGFSLPTFLVKFVAKSDMVKYLRQLKKNIEAK